MITESVLYYFYLLITLIFVNSVGKIALSILNIKPEKKIFRIFLELVFGVTLIVFLYSVFKTGFMTINILFVFLFLYYYFIIGYKKISFLQKNQFLYLFRSSHKDILILALCCLPFFLFELFYLYSSSGFIIPHGDYFLYLELSDSLNYSGRENLFLSQNILFPDQFKGIQPYHYFELWLNAFVSKLFHCPSLYSLLLIAYPCLNCIVYIGFVALWESYYKVSFLSFCVLFILFFTDNVYLPFYDNFRSYFSDFLPSDSSLFSLFGKKYSSTYIFIILFLLLFVKDRKKEAFIALSGLLIVSVGLVPATSIGVLGYILLNRFHHTFIPKDNRKLFIFYAMLLLLFYIVYFILGYSNKSINYISENSFINNLLSDVTNIKHYKYMFGMLMYRFVRCFFLFLPYILISIIIYKTLIKSNKDFLRLIILVLFFNFAGLLCYGFALGLTNSQQLFTNTFTFTVLLINLIIILGFVKLIQLNNTIQKYLCTLCFIVIFILNCVNMYNNDKSINRGFKERYSISYINNIIAETVNKPFIHSAALFSEKEIMLKSYDFLFTIKPGRVIQLSYGYRDIININAYTLFDTSKKMSNISKYQMQNSEFYLFTKNQKKLGLFKNYEQSQLDFIDKYYIKYVFANKDANLSELLKNRISKEIVDSLSGEQFYILSDENSK